MTLFLFTTAGADDLEGPSKKQKLDSAADGEQNYFLVCNANLQRQLLALHAALHVHIAVAE